MFSMARFTVLRISQIRRPCVSPSPRTITSRAYATSSPPPPSSQPANKANASNPNMIYAALGIAAAAGGYWYYTHPEDVNAAKKKAEADEVNRRGRESIDAVKARADDAYQRGQAKYETKDVGKDKLASTRSSVDEKIQEAERRARQTGADAQAEYNSYKASAQKTLENARDSTEELYKEGRSMADRKVTEAAEKGEEVKASWSSWLGWGKSEAEKRKRDAARKVADTAEDVNQRADKQT